MISQRAENSLILFSALFFNNSLSALTEHGKSSEPSRVIEKLSWLAFLSAQIVEMPIAHKSPKEEFSRIESAENLKNQAVSKITEN